MHEANAVRGAIRHAVAERDAIMAGGRPPGASHLELEIVDPTRASPEAVQLYAPPVLEELGLSGVTFDVFVLAVRCSLCTRLTHVEPSDPVCQACGAPVPRTDGPAIVAAWTRPSALGVDLVPSDAGSRLADRQRRHVARVHR